ncbi:hypothetical protein B7494_g5709 [Chlorociboria aeruginascens]|nr:hypothetical protein B7494_g5709 [Chlorociboria aeruginascens]
MSQASSGLADRDVEALPPSWEQTTNGRLTMFGEGLQQEIEDGQGEERTLTFPISTGTGLRTECAVPDCRERRMTAALVSGSIPQVLCTARKRPEEKIDSSEIYYSVNPTWNGSPPRQQQARSRTTALVVAIASLLSNTLSAVLFHHLPDDPYHLASKFRFYLHFANILSVFGFVGALREHAISIAIFANYLILDTILCSIPRFLVLALLQHVSPSLCATPAAQFSAPTPEIHTPLSASLGDISQNWSEESCMRIVYLAQLTLGAGVVAATLLQFVGALCVREYAKGLWVKEIQDEARVLAAIDRTFLRDDRGVPFIFELADEQEKCEY